jgi:hypothetical protein
MIKRMSKQQQSFMMEQRATTASPPPLQLGGDPTPDLQQLLGLAGGSLNMTSSGKKSNQKGQRKSKKNDDCSPGAEECQV